MGFSEYVFTGQCKTMLNIFRTSNFNLGRTKTEGELPAETQGLFPPYVKAHHSEQYNGREASVHFYQEPGDLVWAIMYENSTNPELASLNAGSNFYMKFVEIWKGNILVAVICGNEYCSPQEHIEKHKEWKQPRSFLMSSKLGDWHLNLIETQGIEGLIHWYEEAMKIPDAMTKKHIEKHFSGYTPRSITTLRLV